MTELHPQGPAAPKPAVDSTARGIGWMIVASGVVVAAAAWLPWVSVDVGGKAFDIDDGSRDRVITLVLAIVAIAFGLLRGLGLGRLPLAGAIIVLVLGVSIGFVALIDYGDLADTKSSLPAGVVVSAGIGLQVTFAGGIAMAVYSVAGIFKRR